MLNKCLKEFQEDTSKHMTEINKKMQNMKEEFNEDMYILKNQVEILKMKNSKNKTKTSEETFTNRLDQWKI
jgi:hypothetical protein